MTAADRQADRPIVRLYPRRTAGLIGWLSLGLFLGPVLLEVIFKQLGYRGDVIPARVALVTCLVVAPLVALFAAYLRAFGLGSRASLTVDDRDLIVARDEGAQRIDRAEILGGFVKPSRAGATVELELSRGRLLGMSAPSLDAGEALLARLGLDPGKRRARISLANQGLRIASGVLIAFSTFMVTVWGMMALDNAIGFPKPLPFPAIVGLLGWWVLAPWAIIRATRPPVVVLGAEGLRIERPFRTRFVAYDAIEDVEVTKRGLVLRLAGGEREVVGGGWATVGQYVPAIAKRIRTALQARAQDTLSHAQLALLARQDRTIARWKAHLQAALATDPGYRGVAVRVEDLGRVLESDASTAEQKLAAALALKGAAPDTAAAPIRVAADRAASPKFRVALERIALGDGEEAAIEEALAETAPPPRSVRRG